MEEYQIVNNSETVSAITEKIAVNNEFIGRLINSQEKIQKVLEQNGFELYGQVNDIFEETFDDIRKNVDIIIKQFIVVK